MPANRREPESNRAQGPGTDAPRRTSIEIGRLTQAATRTALSAVELQLDVQRAGTTIPKMALVSYLHTVEAFAPSSDGPDGRSAVSDRSTAHTPSDGRAIGQPLEPARQVPMHPMPASSDRTQQVGLSVDEPPARSSEHPRPTGNRVPEGVQSDPEPAAPATRTHPAPSSPPRSAVRAEGTHRRLESPLVGAAVADEVEPPESTSPPPGRRAQGGSPDRSSRNDGDRANDRGPPSPDDRPGGETPLLGADASVDHHRGRADPGTAGEFAADDQDRDTPEPDELPSEAEMWAADRSDAESTTVDGGESQLDRQGGESECGRHVDEPESALEGADSDDQTADERVEDPSDDRTEDSSDDRTEDSSDERTEAPSEKQRAADDQSEMRADSRPDDTPAPLDRAEEESTTDEDGQPDVSSSLFSRIFGR